MIAMIGFGFYINTFKRSPHTCLFICFEMSSPAMPLLEFMPRQSCEDVVLIGTYSVIRYAKKKVHFGTEFHIRNLIDILHLPAVCLFTDYT
jgi:hypothetical protein